MRRAGVVGVVLIAAFVTTGGSASAVKLCVPEAEEREVLTLKHGKCRRGYKVTSLGAEGKEGKAGKTGADGTPGPEGKAGPEGKTGPEGKAGTEGKSGTTGFTSGELETLKGILPCIRSVKEGIGGKPTVQFSGCNVQIVNGEGRTESTNGDGNLVIGYDEEPREQTGSHNLVLGREQQFTSYGGIVAGNANTITAPFASVSGGEASTASGFASSISGGEGTASGFASSISGGMGNIASGVLSSVSGGQHNTASGTNSSVSGGEENTASGVFGAWIGGGFGNNITNKNNPGEEGLTAAIFGGIHNTTSQNGAAIP